MLILASLCVHVYGQSSFVGNIPMHRFYQRNLSKHLIHNGGHTSIKPYLFDDVDDTLNLGFNKTGYTSGEGKMQLGVQLLSDLELGIDINETNSGLAYRGGAGVRAMATVSNRLHLNVDYLYNYVDGPSYVDSMMSQLGVDPGFGRVSLMGDAFGRHQLQGYLHFDAGKFFSLQAGNGKHFFGDGYRSLLLSDVTNNYPYFKITTSVWKVKYVNLFTKGRHIYGVEDQPDQFSGKFTATHYLDWQVSKRVNLALFESIVWLQEDTLLQRGYDLNYINPIIFYRPVEFQQGSADNAIMGLNLSVNIGKKTKAYGQFVIDEFLLEEVKSDSGWWANKYGGQIGVKTYDVIEGLDLQTEFSAVRPYTFTHGTPVQNYGHDNGSLGHPYAANYWEWVNLISYRRKKWVFEEQFNLGMHGEDSIPSIAYGGNIFISYSNRPEDYGHFTGQGSRTMIVYNHLKASYLLKEKMNLWADIGWVYRERKSGLAYQSNHYIYIGLKTNLWNRYNDY